MAFSENFTTASDITTDAGFRAWGLAIRTAIVAAGLVQTSDTGQIDFGTVSAPSAGNYGGYDIFRFDDAAQATDPIYLKLEYGRGATSGRHQLRLTGGTATNGAGTITNGSGTIALVAGTGTPTQNCYIAASLFDGVFTLYDCQNPGSTDEREGLTFIVERLRDPTGATGIGWGIITHAGGTIATTIRSGGSWAAGSNNVIVNPCMSLYGGVLILGGIRYSNSPSQSRGIRTGPAALPRNLEVTVDDGSGTAAYKTLPVLADYNSIFTSSAGDVCGLIRIA